MLLYYSCCLISTVTKIENKWFNTMAFYSNTSPRKYPECLDPLQRGNTCKVHSVLTARDTICKAVICIQTSVGSHLEIIIIRSINDWNNSHKLQHFHSTTLNKKVPNRPLQTNGHISKQKFSVSKYWKSDLGFRIGKEYISK